jgi:pteridine reductase
MNLADRAVLVTGAGRRVGRAIALHLAERGARVAVHYNESRAGADAVVSQINAMGSGRAIAAQADLTDPDALPALIGDVVTGFGGLDVLVNSAAVMNRTPFGSVTAGDWDAILSLNLRAPFLLAQAAAPHLAAARGGGVVVNVADLSAYETWPAYIPHGLSKSGLVYMTRALARVLAPSIRVNGVAPGTVLPPSDWSAPEIERLRSTTPLQRTGEPEDVARAVAYLVESDYVTGETLVVDGGRLIR